MFELKLNCFQTDCDDAGCHLLYCHLFEMFAEQVSCDPADARAAVQRPLRARPRPRLAAAQQQLQELARAVNVGVRDLDQSAMSIQRWRPIAAHLGEPPEHAVYGGGDAAPVVLGPAVVLGVCPLEAGPHLHYVHLKIGECFIISSCYC